MKNLPLILISFFILFAPFYMEAQFNSSLLSKHQKVSYSHSNLESAYLKKPLNTSLFTFSSYQDNFPKSLHPLSGSWSPRPKYSVNNLMFSPKKNNNNMLSNRRLKYSSLWAFNSLNYLYADLVGVMDVNLLSQYQTGTVNGINITPGFLTAAAAYMQLPLSNVFLPHVIKNDKTLRCPRCNFIRWKTNPILYSILCYRNGSYNIHYD